MTKLNRAAFEQFTTAELALLVNNETFLGRLVATISMIPNFCELASTLFRPRDLVRASAS